MKVSAGCGLAAVLPVGPGAAEDEAAAREIPALKRRFVDRHLRTVTAAVPESVTDLVQGMRSDGTWRDLAENAPPLRGQVSFPALHHVQRLRRLAGAYRLEHDAGLREKIAQVIHRGLGFWLRATPPAPAAWFSEIGAPTQLGQMALLAEEILTPEERAGVVRLMRASVQPDGSLVYSGKPATGQNLVWEAHLQVVVGCLTNDTAYLARYARRAEQEMQITLHEGIQPDYSFHQHGAQLYSGGYGQDFAEDCARLASVLAGTPFAFTPETVDTLLSYVLDGQQWMIRGRHWDFGAIGRWVAWPGGTRVSSPWRAGFPGAVGLALACRDLEPLAGARRDELHAFTARLEGRASAAAHAPMGCRVFWSSDYVAMVRPEFFIAVRMSSRRVIGSETAASGQGTKNWHLGDGATCLMRSGNEYADIAPVWNWRRLPGVTCPDTPHLPLPRNVWGRGAEGGSDFAGGASDGEQGVAAMELARGGARARKAWFFLGDCVVCLGVGLRADKPGVALATGIEQCWSQSPVITDSQLTGSRTRRGETWVHHDGVTYLFGADSKVGWRREQRSGNWSVVNTFIHAPEPVQGTVFELWLEHEIAATDARYHYVIAPGLKISEIEAFKRDGLPEVVSNTIAVQAIAAREAWQAVFWRAGSVELPGAGRLTVDAPSVLTLKRRAGGWTVAAGNPSQAVRTLHVALTGDSGLRAGWATTFDFPAGGAAGRPQSRLLPVG